MGGTNRRLASSARGNHRVSLMRVAGGLRTRPLEGRRGNDHDDTDIRDMAIAPPAA